jgi:hypothetical protein
MAVLVKNQDKTAEVQDGGKAYRVTFVQGETTEIDEPGLRKALGATQYRKYTQEKLDRKKLEAALDQGEVDPIVVGQHVRVKPNKPFLRYTEKEITSDEHQG